MSTDRVRRFAFLFATSALAGLAFAAPSAAQTAQTAQTQPVRSFTIAPQPLAAALRQFSEQSGIQLAYRTEELSGIASRGVNGSMAPEAALRALLVGTTVTYSFTAANTVTLTRLSGVVLPTISAEGTALGTDAMIGNLPPEYAGGQVARGGQLGLLGTRDVMDTPFNQTNYTAKTIADQQARSIGDVAKNDPSVRTTWADGSYSNQFVVRGFPLANADIAINGLYGLVPTQMAGVSWAERIEVLKGPSALLNGMAPQGSVGGSINVIPKRASDDPLTRLTLGYVSDGQVGEKVDLSRRFGADQEFGVRFNGSYSDGDNAVDGQSNQLGEAALALDYRGDRIRLSADLIYQKNYADNPTRPVYARAGFKVPDAPDASSDLGQSYYFADGEDTLGILRGEFDITDWATAYATFGARHNDFIGLYNFSYIKDAAGNFDANVYYQPTYNDSMTGETGLRTKFTTGAVRHEANFSIGQLYNESGALAPIVQTYSSNLYNPGDVAFPNLTGRAKGAPKTSASTLTSVAFSDSLYMFDDRLQIIVGGRQQNVQQQGWNATTGSQTASYNKSALTPASGIVVKPLENVSLYANYIEGLSQGPTATAGAVNAGETFAPIKSKQQEVGVKVDFGKIATTLSAFRLEQPVGLLNAATNRYGVDGENRNDGLELNVFGEVADGVRLLGGVVTMDGIQTKTLNGANNGKEAIGVPDWQFNLGGEWDLPFLRGLTVNGRYIYTSGQYVSADNSQSIADWSRFDLGARYVFERAEGQPITLRFSIENLFDESYWSAASSSFGLARGAPRTYLLSTTFDF